MPTADSTAGPSRRTFAPISFQGYFDIAAENGGEPAALQEAVLEFDRDGRLDTRGLATCSPAQIDEQPRQARSICASIVGTGHVAAIPLPGPARSCQLAADIFNGPPQNGNPTVILHARTTFPATQTFAVVVPIEPDLGAFSYRATIDVPPIAGGLGALTHVDAKIGRRFSVGKAAQLRLGPLQQRRPSDPWQLHLRAGTTISGAVLKPCTPR